MTHLDYLNKDVRDLHQIMKGLQKHMDILHARMERLDKDLRDNLDATNEKIRLQIEAKQINGDT